MSAILDFEQSKTDLFAPELDFSALDRLPTDHDLPDADGVPMDNWWHRLAMNLLIESIECHWLGRQDFYVGGDMFMYFSSEQVFNKDFRGPDFFVVKGVDRNKTRRSWVSWQEGGRLPNVIIELQSESSAHVDHVVKKQFYGERFQTPEYFIYNPFDDEWTGYRLENGVYENPLPKVNGRIWSNQLELFVGAWTGPFQNHVRRWARFFDKDGKLVPIFGEAEKLRADAAQQRADTEAVARQAAEAEIANLKAELQRLKNSNP
jgi:Uma2 family endonuclease